MSSSAEPRSVHILTGLGVSIGSAGLTLVTNKQTDQARRNVFISGGYKFVQTLYNLVVKVVCLKF